MLKYNIKSIIAKRGLLSNDVYPHIRVNKDKFSRWINIKKNSTTSIPSDKLREISIFLECSMEDLYATNIIAKKP